MKNETLETLRRAVTILLFISAFFGLWFFAVDIAIYFGVHPAIADSMVYVVFCGGILLLIAGMLLLPVVAVILSVIFVLLWTIGEGTVHLFRSFRRKSEK